MIVTVPDSGIGCLPVVSLLTCGSASVGGDLVQQTAAAAANGLMGAFESFLTGSASWLVGHIAGLTRTPSPDLGATWFADAVKPMKQLIEILVVPLLLAATIGAVLRQDLRRLGRIWGVGLPLALIAGLGGAVFAKVALQATDEITGQVTGSFNLTAALGGLDFQAAQDGLPVLISVVVLMLTLFGAVLIWLELLMRSAAVYVALFFMPLALTTYVWPAMAHIAKRCIEIVVALIVSKFVILATISLGLAAATKGSSADSALVGAGILLVAAFAPFTLLRLAPIVEVAAISHLEGLSRRPFRAAARATAAAAAAPSQVARVLAMARSRTAEHADGAGRANVSAVTPQPLASRAPDYPLHPERANGR